MDSYKSYFGYWGKANPATQDQKTAYHLLPYHSLDVAAVGHSLLQSHVTLRKRLASLMRLPEDQAVVWCVFLLGVHDLGKFAETFQQLRPDLRQQFWPAETISKKNYSIRHDSLGEMLWTQKLSSGLFSDAGLEVGDFVTDTLPCWLNPVFGHHGWPPSAQERVKNHFVQHDQQAAQEFVQDWQNLIQPDFESAAKLDLQEDWQCQQKKASWLLAGVAVLADWLGSNQEIFTYRSTPMPLADYWYNLALPRADQAVKESGLLPKQPKSTQPLTCLFPKIATPTSLQAHCEQVAISSEPQLFILEDVTGAGKTEAALMLAHRLMSSGLAQGLYIGLPTMATANAMYERMTETYQRLYETGEIPSLILSHSARHLSEKFQQSLLKAQSNEQNYQAEESISAQCNRWLADNRKKALLADVGIGTIDQALLGIVPARHQSLRLLGLLNKVLILDEVHAYDAYTNELLKRLIEFHAAFGGSVILLSATLTYHQRNELVHAFYGNPTKRLNSQQLNDQHYPLLTQASADIGVTEYPLATRESVKRRVDVVFCHQQTDIFERIKIAVSQGKSVCWIRNTVPDAREAWQHLNTCDWLEPDKLHLFHSRYALGDRIGIEQQMLAYFGDKSTPEQREGRVLIATQVVEQSLDLDIDLMISDLAPVDLLIQRAGRLQRHSRDKQGRRLSHGETDQRGTPCLIVHSPEFTESPEADWFKGLFPKAHYVYPHTLLLWRTVKILQQQGGWRMPDDARELLEFVYNPAGEIPEGLDQGSLEAEGEDRAKKDNANFLQMKLASGYADNPQWDEEARIATRLGEESHTLYLARWENNQLMPWINKGKYPWDLSSVKVNRPQLEKLAEIENTALQQALNELRAETKLFDEFSFIVPLIDTASTWQAKGMTDNNKPVTITYGKQQGLELRY
ncbi:MAG: CRISPR-associated helicase Cas3' [Porticoccaceae bacterium]|nr:CRISPR-associated helicase Cas3' [Porticoccaceae bacterium]